MNEKRTVARLGLADSLRHHTRALHAEAEQSGIVSDILRGRASRIGCIVYLRNLFAAYRALENALDDNRETAGVRRLVSFRFDRATALADDLAHLCREGWRGQLPLLPAGESYAGRVAAVAATDASRLIAHAYTRYLADLNGGAVMGRMLARAVATNAVPLRFLDFGTDAEGKALAARFRRAIDEAGTEISDWAPVIEEAVMAFHLNIALSREAQAITASSVALGMDADPLPVPGQPIDGGGERSRGDP